LPLPVKETIERVSVGNTKIESNPFDWMAVLTRTRFEKKVCAELKEKGIETFLPLYSAKHKWSDRQAVVQLPLFPGYVFARIAPRQEERIPVLRTLGVMGFVGARGIGTPIPESEIQAVQTLLEQRVPFQLYPFLNIGHRVRIRGGCLDGIEGILTAINGDESLVVSVQLIQRSIALQINGYEVEPVRTAVPIVNRNSSLTRKSALIAEANNEIHPTGLHFTSGSRS
jgi:transcription antitermination factor NusG